MAVYMPVLQARQGELIALGEIDGAAVPVVQPVFEAVVYDEDHRLGYTAERLAMLAADNLVKGTAVAVDCVHLDRHYGAGGQDGRVPMREVSEMFRQMLIAIRPVIRLTGAGRPDQRVLETAAEAADLHGVGACLRVALACVGAQALPDLIEQAATAADRLGCQVTELDLLCDCGPVLSRSQIPAAVEATSIMLTALSGLPWRSMVVAAAAFPDSIGSVPLGRCAQFPRLDADIWRQLTTRRQAWAGTIGFGDYGVAGTSLPPRRALPAPNLRYTAEVCWHIYRYPKDSDGRFSTFHELCREVTGTLWWAGENYSWGDREIAKRAQGHAGPGTAKDWRAYSLSHHLAVVVDELRRHAA